MKVLLYCVVSQDGFIAGKSDDISWVSKQEWRQFSRMVNGVGNIIIGRRTYDVVMKEKKFDNFENIFTIVMSRQNIQSKEGFHFTNAKPKNILKLLNEKGFSSTLVCGGLQINKLFLESGLVDQVFVDIEPIIVGEGLNIKDMIPENLTLKLLREYEYSPGHVQKQYLIEKGIDG